MSGLCRIRFISPTKEDSGKYTCKVDEKEIKTICNLNFIGKILHNTTCSYRKLILVFSNAEYPFKFTKPLANINACDKEAVILECEVDDEEAVVVWKKGTEVLPANDKKIQIQVEGKKRRLFFKEIRVADGGDYSCSTNADETKSEVSVDYVNKFVKKLKDTNGVEREKLVLEVEVADITAQTDWFLKGEQIKPSERFEIKNLGGGKHQLIISNLDVSDAGELKCRSGKLKSTMQLTVHKGETPPQINLEGPVEGPTGKPLIIDVPYTGKLRTSLV